MKFYKETSFKKTPIGKIPKDWGIVRIGDIITYVKGKKPKEMVEECQEDYLPYLSTEYLRDNKVTSFVKHSQDVILVDDGDLILLWDGSKAGEFFFGKRGVLSSTMVKIEQKKKKYEQKFLFYLLKAKESFLKGQTKGTGIPHVDRVVLSNIIIPYPSFAEQQKIVEVLSVIDEVIQKIDEVIARTERLKKGLMQELLTKGIGHKEFKDTEIGKIPKEWEVVKLFSVAEAIMGQSPPSSTYNKEGNGLPFLQGKMEFGDIYPSPMLYCSKPIKIAEPNDILISVRAPVGDVNLTPYKLCIGRGLAAIRFHNQDNNYLFYFYYLQEVKNVIESMGKGSTFKAIIKGDLENLKVPRPPPSEQQKIAEILLTVDKKLEVEREEKERLLKVKQSLMDLLLTGKIRIKVD